MRFYWQILQKSNVIIAKINNLTKKNNIYTTKYNLACGGSAEKSFSFRKKSEKKYCRFQTWLYFRP